jgi:hypothetical protein
VEALVIADASATPEVLASLEDAISAAGAEIVLHLGTNAIVVDADPAVHALLPQIVVGPFTLYPEPPPSVPASLDEDSALYLRGWSLTASGPLAEAAGPRTDDGMSFDQLGCKA